MSSSAVSAPVTMLVTRHIAPERYSDFLSWMRQGEILAAGFPGFLGSGVLQPPEGGDEYQIVLRFTDEASLLRWEKSLPRRMWLERGANLVRASHEHRVSGTDGWFAPKAASAPPRWKQAVSIWLAYFPVLLVFSILVSEHLNMMPVFWRVLITSVILTPIMVFICIPVISRVLQRWLRAG
ncbi:MULTISPECIES: antibiotic biosynthesis monooxygenase [Achromobacter]|jgi:antibiotic biosynthesis monooxygenase (ABM) superfamily enzyme|uniref:Antibiotic biosynthesis monooxygenase n=1 Tax=Achromobacter spanius TaxID=217203 RepID=A0AA42LTQ5_9BURK|nr:MULTISPECIES: antibiotic biosynthesis monooxygenase [Achromobacter]MCS3504551.1 antibiotic biosynthesis monooxygenase (ABM) superfamily enzyme [Achromobacter sp. JUb104]MDH0739336.1 antibiotic biosynthesis monooxygenase [Achromobacter spanius]